MSASIVGACHTDPDGDIRASDTEPTLAAVDGHSAITGGPSRRVTW